MRLADHDNSTGTVYRLDRFVVPPAAREEFLLRVGQTHEILRSQQGFVQDLVIEKQAEHGASIIVTMVEWDSSQTVERVVPIVQAFHREIGFDPRETVARLGIQAEIGAYRQITARVAAVA